MPLSSISEFPLFPAAVWQNVAYLLPPPPPPPLFAFNVFNQVELKAKAGIKEMQRFTEKSGIEHLPSKPYVSAGILWYNYVQINLQW